VASKIRGLVISRQVASAQAFKAWLAESSTRETFDLDFKVYPPSAKDLSGAPVEKFQEPLQSYDFLITGTSLEAKDDAQWWAWARSKKIPSIAYVDQWINYEERFSKEVLPDFIFVTDETAKKMMENVLPSGPEIIVTGSPALNYIREFWKLHKKETQQQTTVNFATEPTTEVYREKQGVGNNNNKDPLI